jgi:hypothetical protein
MRDNIKTPMTLKTTDVYVGVGTCAAPPNRPGSSGSWQKQTSRLLE